MLSSLGLAGKAWHLLLPSSAVAEAALLVVWAALLCGGFVFGKRDARRDGRIPRWTRIASSAILVAAAASGYIFTRGTSAATFALLVAVGMSLGFLGDLLLARLLPVADPVPAGMAAFGLGHVAYIAGGLTYGNSQGLAAPGPRFGAWALWLLIGLAGWYFAVFRGQRPTFLHWAALPYALLLASTAGVALGMVLQPGGGRLLPFAIGAGLFLVSDLILAAHLFTGRGFHLIGDAIWLTYGPGQMLIVCAAMNLG